MLVRITKKAPAPLMDGFDVSRFRVGELYDVPAEIGRYLVTSKYAEKVSDSSSDQGSRAIEACDTCGGGLAARQAASGFAIPSTADYVCLKCRRAFRWDGERLTVAHIVY